MNKIFRKMLSVLLCGFMALAVVPAGKPIALAANEWPDEIGESIGGIWGGVDWTFEVTQADGKGKLTIAPTTGTPVTNMADRSLMKWASGEKT